MKIKVITTKQDKDYSVIKTVYKDNNYNPA